MHHLEFARSETASLYATETWERWADHAEKLIGHSLDGDRQKDGFSIDEAFEVFDRGCSPAAYVTMVATRANYRKPA